MTERLTDSPVNERETVIMRAVRLAYRLGRQDHQRFVESACRKKLHDEDLAVHLRELACDFPHEPVSFDSIVRAAEFDSTAVNNSGDE